MIGHVMDALKQLPDNSAHCIVTSPPYWSLRDYKLEPQIWDADPDCPHTWEPVHVPPEPDTGNWQQAENGPSLRTGVPQTRFRGDTAAARKGGSAWREIITPAANGLVNNDMQGETLNPDSATRSPRFSAVCERCGGWQGSLGLEPTPDLYVKHMVDVFREVRRVLHDDGTIWLNMGDCYVSQPSWSRDLGTSTLDGRKQHELLGKAYNRNRGRRRTGDNKNPNANVPEYGPNRYAIPGLKPKDLVGMPWRVAFALQADGWWRRDFRELDAFGPDATIKVEQNPDFGWICVIKLRHDSARRFLVAAKGPSTLEEQVLMVGS